MTACPTRTTSRFTLAVADTVAVALDNLGRREELAENLNQIRDENLQLRERLGVQSEIVGSSTAVAPDHARDRPRGAQPGHGADSRPRAAQARSWWPARFTSPVRGARDRSYVSTALRCRVACWRVSYLAMSRAHSPSRHAAQDRQVRGGRTTAR